MLRFISSFAVLIGALVVAPPAHAVGSLTRTFVSSTGSDSNACTITAPCATFAHAYTQVAANGIIAALDPGKYGPLTITGPVTIDGNGWAAITAPVGGSGILIQAESSDNVILRGITIDGGGASATNGIEFDSGASLTITGCAIRLIGGGHDGLDFYNRSSSAETLTVADSQFIDNGKGSGGVGISVQASGAGSTTVSFVRTESAANDIGIAVFADGAGGVSSTATDSIVVNNGQFGVQVASSAATVNFSLASDQIAGNGIGIVVNDSNAATSLAKTAVVANATSAFAINSGGVLNSYGNNYFADNGNNNSTTGLTTVGTQ